MVSIAARRNQRAARAGVAGRLWGAVALAAACGGLLPPGAMAQSGATADRAVLEALYDATGGPTWKNSANWKTDAPLHQWSGVETDADGRVTWLRLWFNGLSGPIPSSLENLSNLATLDLSWNGLSGPIPSSLGNLSNLATLDLSLNSLSGPIPSSLGNLSDLATLHLYDNDLSGPIPSSLGNLSNLATLDLSLNSLSGPIPSSLGNLSNLEELRLDVNELSGSIPPAIGRLSNLRSLELSSNWLNGSIPSGLGNLSNLEALELAWNPELSGPLPGTLTGLSRLTLLDIRSTALCAPRDAAFEAWLADIQFQGSACNRAPEPVGTIPAQTLTAGGTARGLSMAGYFHDPDDEPLTYAATSSRGDTVAAHVAGDVVWLAPRVGGSATVTVTALDPRGLDAARTLAVTVVDSTGPRTDREVLETFYDTTGGPTWTDDTSWKTDAPLDEWYGVYTDADGAVIALTLVENGLSGPIPSSLGSLSSLRSLYLAQNELGGPIPPSLGNLSNLESLLLSWNELSGPIPPSLGNLSNLQNMRLDGNRLSGSIPPSLGSLSNLQRLSLASNGLSGAIPSSLGNLSNLQALWLADSGLSGPLPPSLGNLSSLAWLDLGLNGLSGPLPSSLGNLSNLEWLDLGFNGLSGPLPSSLGNLSNLQGLDLGFNGLSGPLPSSLGNLSNLTRMNLYGNWGLSGPLPSGLRQAPIDRLNLWLTQACAPRDWRTWLASIEGEFRGALCGAGRGATVDIAVVYTPSAREASGGVAEIEAVIDLMIAGTNQAYADSGVHHRVALVAREEVPYTETGDSFLDLDRLAAPSDGHMDGVHALRDRVGADLVHLLVDGDKASVGGVTYLDGVFGLSVHNGGVGVFGHETGHNMGLYHERYQARRDTGAVWAHPAYGHVNRPSLEMGADASRQWNTLMAYGSECFESRGIACATLYRFSNPRQRYNGDPMGVPFGAGGSGLDGAADAVAVLNVTGPAVARWRDRPSAGANRPPSAVGALPDRRLAPRATLNVDVSRAFVDPDGDLLTFGVSSSAPRVATVAAAGARVAVTAVGEGTATIRVTATDPGGLSASQSFTVTVSPTVAGAFTDDPIQPGVTPIRAVHFTELRARIDALRAAAGLPRFAWTDPVLRAGATPVRLAHLLELRAALGAAYAAAGRAVPRWTDAAPAGGATPIRAAHLTELRAAVVGLE